MRAGNMGGLKLSKRTVEGLQPGPAPFIAFDVDLKGFGCRVTPTGAKSWLVVDCFRFGGQIPASRRGGFERLGTDAAEMALTAGSVVEDLNAIERIGSGEVSGVVDSFADAFLLQTAEE